jgi:hypothetical protein
MYNWSTDEKKLSGDALKIWRLEQMINFGLNGEKLPESDLKRLWSKLNLDKSKATFIQFLLNESR